jgi:hypothetical protein
MFTVDYKLVMKKPSKRLNDIVLGESEGRYICIPDNDDALTNITVTGLVGSGKTTRFAVNQVIQCISRGEPVALYDTFKNIEKRIRSFADSSGYEFTIPAAFRFFCGNQICLLENSAVISSFVTKAVNKARNNENGGFERPLNLIIDGLCGCERIKDLSEILAIDRSHNIRLTLLFQSISDLKKAYPNDEWKTILVSCNIKVFMSPLDDEDSKYLSDMSGRKIGKTGLATAVLSPEFLGSLPRGKEIIAFSGMKPVIAAAVHYGDLLKMHGFTE